MICLILCGFGSFVDERTDDTNMSALVCVALTASLMNGLLTPTCPLLPHTQQLHAMS